MIESSHKVARGIVKLGIGLGLVVLTSQGMILQNSILQSSNAKVINVAGRQRMLSERLAKNILLLSSEPSRADSITSDLNELVIRNKDLLNGNPDERIRSAFNDDLKANFIQLGSQLADVKSDIICVLQKCPGVIPENSIIVAKLAQFRANMDETVNMAEESASRQAVMLAWLQSSLTLLGLLILVFGFMWVILPFNRNLIKHLKDLKKKQGLTNHMERSAQIGWWELDLESGITTWSDEVYRIHKIPIGSVVSKEEGINFYAPHERPRLVAMIEECIKSGKPFDADFEFYDSEGERKWVHSFGEPLKDDRG